MQGRGNLRRSRTRIGRSRPGYTCLAGGRSESTLSYQTDVRAFTFMQNALHSHTCPSQLCSSRLRMGVTDDVQNQWPRIVMRIRTKREWGWPGRGPESRGSRPRVRSYGEMGTGWGSGGGQRCARQSVLELACQWVCERCRADNETVGKVGYTGNGGRRTGGRVWSEPPGICIWRSRARHDTLTNIHACMGTGTGTGERKAS